MTKVLFDHQIFSHQIYGGISRYFANIHHAIQLVADVESSISTLYSENFYIKDDPGLLGQFFGKLMLPSPRKIHKWNRKYSKDTIERNDFDILHPTYYDPYFINYVKRPYIITVHDMIHELYPDFFLPTDHTAKQKKMCVENAAHIIAISHSTKNDLVSILGVDPDRISVIHHGYTPQLLTIQKENPIISSRYFLYVGERQGYKNFSRMVKAFSHLSPANPDITLICAGGKTFTNEEQENLIRLDISSKVIQINASDDDLSNLYSNCIAFIYPSLYEGFGLPILEAFQNNCAILAAENPCFKEIGEDAIMYFDPLDEQSIFNAINVALNESLVLEALIIKGKAQLQKFTMNRCISETLNVYRQYS